MNRSRVLVVAAAVLLAGCLSNPSIAPLGPADPSLLRAAHRDANGAFFNPWHRFNPSLLSYFRLKLTRNPYGRAEGAAPPVRENDGSELDSPVDRPRITWVGHATMIIHDGSDIIVTDPMYSNSVLPLTRRKVRPGLPLEKIPKDAIGVISHDHFDHLDKAAVKKLPATMQWFVPLGLAKWFHELGRDNVVELDWWKSETRGRWKITCLPSQHWSKRFWGRRNMTLWCSWMLESAATRYYFAGDTGTFPGFADFRKHFGPIDVALLPIGAYEPRWILQDQHMSPAEAYQAFRDLGARCMLPLHWGTFRQSFEPLDQAPKDLMAAVDAAGGDRSQVHVMDIGESWEVPER